MVSDIINMHKQDHKQQSHDDKKHAPKNSAKSVKEKVVLPQQMLQSTNNFMSLKGKRQKNVTNINKVFAVMLVKMMN